MPSDDEADQEADNYNWRLLFPKFFNHGSESNSNLEYVV